MQNLALFSFAVDYTADNVIGCISDDIGIKMNYKAGGRLKQGCH